MKRVNQHGLDFGKTLVVCGVIFILYKIFQSPELDREIARFEKQKWK